MKSSDIQQKSAKNIALMVMFRGLRVGIQFFSLTILARILEPENFGAFALANVAIAFIQVLGSAGVGAFIVYYQADDLERKSTAAFWLNLFLTTLLIGFFFASKNLINYFTENPDIWPYIMALLVLFFFQQVQVIPDSLIEKRLKHPRLFVRNFILDTMIVVASIVMANHGWGTWSLVLPHVIMGAPRAISSFFLAQWVPALKLYFSDWGGIFKYSSALILSNFLGYFFINTDAWVIGHSFGIGQLGYFSMANQMANLVGRNVTSIVVMVGKPALSALSAGSDLFCRGYLRMIHMLSVFICPTMVGILLIAHEAILVAYGQKWEKVALILQLLSIYALVRSITSPASLVFQLKGKPQIILFFQTINVLSYLILVFSVFHQGFLVLVIVIVSFKSLSGLAFMYLSLKELNENFFTFIRSITPAIVSCVLMGGSIIIFKTILELSPIIALSVYVPLGVIIYGVSVWFLFPDTVELIKVLIKKIFSKQGTA